MTAGLFPLKIEFSSRQVLPGDRRFQRSTLPCPKTRWRVSCVRTIGRKPPAGRTCRWLIPVSPTLDTQNRNFSGKLPENSWNWTHRSGTLAGKYLTEILGMNTRSWAGAVSSSRHWFELRLYPGRGSNRHNWWSGWPWSMKTRKYLHPADRLYRKMQKILGK